MPPSPSYPSATDITGSRPIQILIVEDESVIAFNLQETLEALGYSVVAIAVSGAQALRRTSELRPNLILMDIRLKGDMDGTQTAAQIWEQFQIPVIYVTGHSDRSTVERAKLTTSFGYLLKPIQERELYVAIESALQRYERERWLNTVLNGIGDGVIVMDVAGRIQFLNPVAEALTGWQIHEARDRPLAEIFNVIEEQTQIPIADLVASVVQEGRVLRLEGNLQLTARDGTLIPVSDSVSPLRDNNDAVTGAVLVFRDITLRQQAEERNQAIAQTRLLQQQMTELEELNRLKDDFLSTVSHELRTPLTNIKMAIRMLEVAIGQQGMLFPEDHSGSQLLERYMNILRSQCDQELSLIEDLLNLQRLDSNACSVELTDIPLSTWVPQVIEAFQCRIQDRQLRLQVNIASNLPPFRSDLPSLNRILVELLNNACKYTPAGEEIIVTVQLANHSDREPITAESFASPKIILAIYNTGVEITPENLEQIFEPFFRVPKSDRWSQGGTGLGLALVKKLVNCLEGSIRVESGNARTGFIVELPTSLVDIFNFSQAKQTISISSEVILPMELPETADRALVTQHLSDSTSAEEMPVLPLPHALDGLRVLVVDDEAAIGTFIKALLEAHGIEVKVVTSSAAALEEIEQFQPDVLLSDIRLPGSDGYDLIRQIRALEAKQGRHIPAAAITAYLDEDREKAFRAGFEAYWYKLSQPTELVEVVVQLVEQATNNQS